jgi:hypothetical protein
VRGRAMQQKATIGTVVKKVPQVEEKMFSTVFAIYVYVCMYVYI